VTTSDDPCGPVPDADPLDELASAIVDGEAGDVEESDDPALAERVARFRAVAELVATPVAPPSAADRDRIIAAALAAAAGGAGGEVVPFRRRRLPVWLPAAAAVAVLVAGIGLLLRTGGDSDDADEAATADAPAAREAETFEESAGEGSAGGDAGAPASTVAETAGGAGTGAATEMVALADLGDHDTVASLEDALLSLATSSEDSAEGPAPAPGLPCSEQFDPDAELYTARLAGQPVVVAVSGTTYVAVDQATCAQVASGTV
jgi:hypothetical protein